MNIASASMKLPMKRKMIGSANGANTTRAGADLQQDGQHRTDERRDRERQRLGDPEDHHHQQDARQPVRRRAQSASAREQQPAARAAAANEADRPPAPIEQLLGRRVGLDGLTGLVQAAHQDFNQRHSDDELGPASQKEPVIVPFDSLRAAGRHDLQIARGVAVANRGDRRGAGAGPGGFGRSDAALPDEDADAVRRFDRGELDVGALAESADGRPARGRSCAAVPR